MCLLQGWLLGRCLAQYLYGQGVLLASPVEPSEFDEEREIELTQLVAPALSPPLVAILGKEIARVQVDGSLVGRRVLGAPCGQRCVLEGVRVHPQPSFRAQNEVLVPEA